MLETQPKIGVIGGGSWATALLKILSDARAKHSSGVINWWLRKQSYIDYLQKHGFNPNYLRQVNFDLDVIKPNNCLEDVIEQSDLLILALPGAFLHGPLRTLAQFSRSSKTIIISIKGMLYDQDVLISDCLYELGFDERQVAVVSGPCHAEEVAIEKFAYLTVATLSENLSAELSKSFETDYIKTIRSDDIMGIQYVGILKNIIALACGIAHGLGYGDNFLSVLVSNAYEEIGRFLSVIAPRARTLSQSVYLGDLLVTCYSQFSRNRIFGNMLGRGYSLESAQLEMRMVAEGYYATKSIYHLAAKNKVAMPIVNTIYEVLYESADSIKKFKKLKKSFV